MVAQLVGVATNGSLGVKKGGKGKSKKERDAKS